MTEKISQGRFLYRTLLYILCVGCFCATVSANQEEFYIASGGELCSLYADPNDHNVCRISMGDLSNDIERICGKKPPIVCEVDKLHGNVIIIGTLGRNPIIDQLILSGKLDVSDVCGQWETFVHQIITHPIDGVDKALVIAGSDRRGTAYGVYELSEQMGISPWSWWADVPVPQNETLVIRKARDQQGPPSVKYRGIFINDEGWGLHNWAANTYAPEDGGIGPATYKQIFELLLRLKANHIWPAMHPCTKAFNAYEENRNVADDYAIVMGSSHCEQLLRNNVYEWKKWEPSNKAARGDWDWGKNSDQIKDYWRQRVKANAPYENIYTMGMRGIHDGSMPCAGATDAEKVIKMQDEIFPAQRQMLAEWVNSDPATVPQIFCPYKEVLNLYNMNMQLPDDITMVWPDDNHGYIRRLSNPTEQNRSGRSGVYYHISYWGAPHDYLWLCSTPPALIWEEMKKAYDYGADQVWVLNVGDIKPAEIGIDFFMQMAWDIDRWNETNLDQYLVQWARRQFGTEHKQDIARMMVDYYRLAQARKPEHMGWSTIYPNIEAKEPEFSLIHYGDESQRRIDQYQQIEREAKKIFGGLPDLSKDAFYQLVYYPIRGASLMNQKYLYAQKSRLYAKQGRVSANDYAQMALNAHEAIIEETKVYNHEIAGGKWEDVIRWNPRGLPVYKPPKVSHVKPLSGASMAIMIEGQLVEAKQTSDTGAFCNQLPDYDVFTKQRHFVDIFNKGDAAFKWQAVVSQPWVRLSLVGGTVEKQQRVWVDVDWNQIPTGRNSVTIKINGANQSIPVVINATNYTDPRQAINGFVQSNGYVSIEAEHFTAKTDKTGASWEIIPTLGRSGDSVTVFPVTTPSCQRISDILSTSPMLEYEVYFNTSGQQDVKVYCLPTHAINSERGLRYAVAFDDQPPQIVEYDTKEWSKPWKINVLRGIAISKSSHEIAVSGRHILKIRMVDPGVVIDKIVIGVAKPSYLGPPETRVNYTD